MNIFINQEDNLLCNAMKTHPPVLNDILATEIKFRRTHFILKPCFDKGKNIK